MRIGKNPKKLRGKRRGGGGGGKSNNNNNSIIPAFSTEDEHSSFVPSRMARGTVVGRINPDLIASVWWPEILAEANGSVETHAAEHLDWTDEISRLRAEEEVVVSKDTDSDDVPTSSSSSSSSSSPPPSSFPSPRDGTVRIARPDVSRTWRRWPSLANRRTW